MSGSEEAEGEGKDKECVLHFLRSPIELTPTQPGGGVAGIKLELNRLEVNT